MNLKDFVVRHAETCATAAHTAIGQTRKYTGDPYIVHPRAVVELVKTAEIRTEEMLAAAWLHDVVEDTKITEDDIRAWFGPIIGGYVWGLTNPVIHGNRRFRFEHNRDRLAGMSNEIKTIKIADLIDNTSTIVAYDQEFARLYLSEKNELLEVLRGGDQGLWQRAKDQCMSNLTFLGAA